MAVRAKCILLAAGLGTRLRPLTDTMPKCLVPIDGRALLDYWVDRLCEAGISQVRINTHSQSDMLRSYLNRLNSSGRIYFTEVYEPNLLGSSGTIKANADLADHSDQIIIIYSDNLSDVDLGRLLVFHRSHGDPLTMLLFRTPNPRACGIAELDDEGRVVSFVEKPQEPRGDLANAGVYVVSADAYREIAALGTYDLAYDVLPRFVGRMRGLIWEGIHIDIGTHESLGQARQKAPGLSGRPGHRRGRPAVFLDRDGTLIEQVHYLSDPARVRLLPGVAECLRRLHEAGFARVVVTNQSAIARGILREEQLGHIHEELTHQLAAEGTTVDAIYYCPEAPIGEDRTIVETNNRKPGPGMLLRATDELQLSLRTSWMVGDMISDALAGINARCRGSIIVRTEKGLSSSESISGLNCKVVDDLCVASDLIIDSLPTGVDAGLDSGDATVGIPYSFRETTR